MWADVLTVAGAIIAICAGAVLAWLEWKKRTPAERAELITDEVRRLVDAAEQIYKEPGSGQTKYGWVMNRLSQRFPGIGWEQLGEYVEQAVHHLNAIKAARHGANTNGKNGM